VFGSSFRQHRTKDEGKGKVTVETMAAEITVTSTVTIRVQSSEYSWYYVVHKRYYVVTIVRLLPLSVSLVQSVRKIDKYTELNGYIS
jgi:hypothetical protein